MNKILSTILLVFTTTSIFAQEPAAERASIPVEKIGEWTPNWDETGYAATLRTERPKHENPYKEELRRYKEEINARKEANKDNLPHTLNFEDAQYKTTGEAVNPSLTKGFSTTNTQGTPSDNTMGINSQGQILVAVNSLIRVYSTSGSTVTGVIDLDNFFSNPRNGQLLSNTLCDPKVLYDPRAKRFIVMAQTCDGASSTSQVLMAFSKTENPAGAWNFYVFTGNPSDFVSGNSWFDYPKMGVNDHDVFVTGNLFSNSLTYKQSVIYHIDKTIGYSGGSYGNNDAAIFYNISGSPFTLVPTSLGRNMAMGNKMYFVSTVNGFSGSTNQLRFYELDGAVQSFPTLNRTDLYITSYSYPSDGVQKGSSVKLDVGDYRGMDAIWVNGTIHFVTHILGPNDYDQILYCRIYKSGGSWTADDYNIFANNVDLAYPSVASMGWTNNDQSVGILMNFASPSHYPSVGCVFVDHNLKLSDIIIAKEGTSYVSVYTQGGVTRWGDYTGMCPEYFNSRPTVWGYGMYGSGAASSWKNYATNIINNQWPTGVEEVSQEEKSLDIFPNPVVDIWNMKFETDRSGVFTANIYTVDGKLVQNLYQKQLNKGVHTFAFNKGVMSPGSYVVTLSYDGEDIASEQILITGE